ncbi:hypothetical protein GF322_00475 [Candidatus Dependentiae bacterium]|nr:hypothetical protein [Candidatus Dependentiae bacterium]
MKFDTLYIPMKKQKETNEFVWYKFEIYEYTDEFKIDDKGRKKNIKKLHVGVFKFYKKNQNSITLENIYDFIKLEESETDSLLLNNIQILAKCFNVMRQHQQEGYFPEITCYAAG